MPWFMTGIFVIPGLTHGKQKLLHCLYYTGMIIVSKKHLKP